MLAGGAGARRAVAACTAAVLSTPGGGAHRSIGAPLTVRPAPTDSSRVSLDRHMPRWAYMARGIRIRSSRRTEPARNPDLALLVRALGGRIDAPASPAAAVGLQAPQGAACGWLRPLTRGPPAARG